MAPKSGTLEDVLAVVCPGQGAQAPGMLSPWLEMPSVAERIARYADAAGLALVAHGTTSDADTIRDTAVAQPLLVATALATARELLGDAASEGNTALMDNTAPSVAAGHSVGEFAAAALAGVFSDTDAMLMVSVRATAIATAAAASEPTSMAAVLGGDPDDVLATLASFGLTPANVNGGGQVVAAGAREAIARLLAEPPAKSRVIELQVAGAFHTAYMKPAVATLSAAAAGIAVADPTSILVSNADGSPVASGARALDLMVAQVANPVRWDLCQQTMLDIGVTAMIEAAPGGVLTGLAKRSMPGIPCFALKSPADLAAARDLMETHS
ncbi:MAG TPA: ACP S-malonyltransferase [Demequinaceae bacterium]